MNARATKLDGSVIPIALKEVREGHVLTVMPEVSDWTDIRYIDIGYDDACAMTGDDGYYIVPRGNGSPDDHICSFEEREDCEADAHSFQMTMYGYVHEKKGWCAIVTGYTYEYHLIRGVKDGQYYMFARFPINGADPYEPIAVEFHEVEGDAADYSGICRIYRNYMLTRRGCVPAKERTEEAFRYAKESLYIRVRMGWKPVPSPIDEQTEENEPEMFVAMTFDAVGELMDRCKAAGVKKAEFCLVGWNVSGHDGRWPQIFPVDERLGGEESLRRLIKKAQDMGYAITCHTNSTDGYSIADCYSDDLVRKNPDGSLAFHGCTWGGGKPRYLCSAKALELAEKDLPAVADLGFAGLHYIDVISTIALAPCYDPKHPVNRREAAGYWTSIAKLSRELFGGFSSEGGYDYTAPYLDYGLYVSFFDSDSDTLPPMFSKCVPLWQIVFHGIILSNPYTKTVNAQLKSRRHQLEVMERGSRPTVYIYSIFMHKGNNWMGNDDFTCESGEAMQRTADAMGELWREHEGLLYLQDLFIDRHEELDPGVFATTYENGDRMIVNYNTGEYSLMKK